MASRPILTLVAVPAAATSGRVERAARIAAVRNRVRGRERLWREVGLYLDLQPGPGRDPVAERSQRRRQVTVGGHVAAQVAQRVPQPARAHRAQGWARRAVLVDLMLVHHPRRRHLNPGRTQKADNLPL